MYDIKPNLIIGFHGCDRQVRNSLLSKPNQIKISQKPYDWLGHGFYFWENNYDRALQWAIDKKKRGGISKPSVIGAILHLGYCCDLLEQKYIRLVTYYADLFKRRFEMSGKKLPVNQDLKTDIHKDRLLRYLDCEVIEYMHATTLKLARAEFSEKSFTKYKIFDSTRGAFLEGGPAFEGAEIREKTHIQICIRNPNCIKGFFLPRREIDFAPWKTNTTILSPAA